jgi:hypothetical protein
MKELKEIKYLYLTKINEKNENELEIIIEEAVNTKKVNQAAIEEECLPELKKLLKKSYMIRSIKGCKQFKLVWDNYTAYNIINESFAQTDTMIKYKDDNRNEIVDSKYLRYIK